MTLQEWILLGGVQDEAEIYENVSARLRSVYEVKSIDERLFDLVDNGTNTMNAMNDLPIISGVITDEDRIRHFRKVHEFIAHCIMGEFK